MSERRFETGQQNVTGQREWPASAERAFRNMPGEDDQDLGSRAREKADDVRSMVDERREQAGEGMERAAESVRSHADQIPGGQRTTDMANQAADRVENVAGYLRDNDMSAMVQDVEQVVRDHPKEALIAAAAVGFLVGRAVRS